MIDQDWQTILFSILGHAFSENHTKNLPKKKNIITLRFFHTRKKIKKIIFTQVRVRIKG